MIALKQQRSCSRHHMKGAYMFRCCYYVMTRLREWHFTSSCEFRVVLFVDNPNWDRRNLKGI